MPRRFVARRGSRNESIGKDHLSVKPVIRPHDKVIDSSELLDECIGLFSSVENALGGPLSSRPTREIPMPNERIA